MRALGGPLRLPISAITPSVKQEVFLRHPAGEVLYGGAAGGGKSAALMLGAEQFVDEPGYSALLLRRTYPQLRMPGGLIPLSQDWYQGHAEWNQQASQWRFTGGATITFGHIQNEQDIYRYLGQEYQYIGFDELTQFTEQMYRYLFSRLRRAGRMNDVPLRMRGASNPGGIGHAWVKRRFVDPATAEPDSAFVKSLLHENPGLDQESYRSGLAKLHPVDRARLEHGDWDVTGEGVLFHRADLLGLLVPANYPVGEVQVRAWDLAATAPHEGNRDPDYTVGLLADHDPATGVTVIRDIVRDQLDPGDVDHLMRLTAEQDGQGVMIRVEQEGGSSGKAAARHVQRNLVRYAVESVHPTGDKVVRAMPFAAACANQFVRIVEAAWTMPYIDELSQFPDGAHDDQVDTSSAAHEALTSGVQPAVVTMPDAALRL